MDRPAQRRPGRRGRGSATRAVLRLAMLALVPLVVGGRPADAQVEPGTYISVEDFRLIDHGLIIPIVEYVEINRQLLGTHTIEVGYLHILPEPMTLLAVVGDYVGRQQGDLDRVGRLDLAGMRRVALAGKLEIGEGELSWTPGHFAMAVHEPGRIPEVLSPFLRATAAALEQSRIPMVGTSVEQDLLWVTAEDGTTRSYRRSDPMVLHMVGLIALEQNLSIGRTYRCLAPLAEAAAAAEPYRFSEPAVAQARARAQALGGAAVETWEGMEARGLGQLLDRYLVAQLAAQQHAGRYLQALLDAEGGLAAVAARWDDHVVLEPAERDALLWIRRFHHFDFDPLAFEPPFADMRLGLEIYAERYQADPWSITIRDVATYLDAHSWVVQLHHLLADEVALLCPDA